MEVSPAGLMDLFTVYYPSWLGGINTANNYYSECMGFLVHLEPL